MQSFINFFSTLKLQYHLLKLFNTIAYINYINLHSRGNKNDKLLNYLTSWKKTKHTAECIVQIPYLVHCRFSQLFEHINLIDLQEIVPEHKLLTLTRNN